MPPYVAKAEMSTADRLGSVQRIALVQFKGRVEPGRMA